MTRTELWQQAEADWLTRATSPALLMGTMLDRQTAAIHTHKWRRKKGVGFRAPADHSGLHTRSVDGISRMSLFSLTEDEQFAIFKQVADQVQAGTYEPGLLRGVRWPKNTPVTAGQVNQLIEAGQLDPESVRWRTILVPSEVDKVASVVLQEVLEPLLDPMLHDFQHGYRSTSIQGVKHTVSGFPGIPRGSTDIVARRLLRAAKSGKHFLGYADVRDAFNQVDRELLAQMLVDDGCSQTFANQVISSLGSHGYLSWLQGSKGQANHEVTGIPLGSPIGPMLFNFYTRSLYKWPTKKTVMSGYADDLFWASDSMDAAQEMARTIREGAQLLGLEAKFKIVDIRETDFRILKRWKLHMDKETDKVVLSKVPKLKGDSGKVNQEESVKTFLSYGQGGNRERVVDGELGDADEALLALLHEAQGGGSSSSLVEDPDLPWGSREAALGGEGEGAPSSAVGPVQGPKDLHQEERVCVIRRSKGSMGVREDAVGHHLTATGVRRGSSLSALPLADERVEAGDQPHGDRLVPVGVAHMPPVPRGRAIAEPLVFEGEFTEELARQVRQLRDGLRSRQDAPLRVLVDLDPARPWQQFKDAWKQLSRRTVGAGVRHLKVEVPKDHHGLLTMPGMLGQPGGLGQRGDDHWVRRGVTVTSDGSYLIELYRRPVPRRWALMKAVRECGSYLVVDQVPQGCSFRGLVVGLVDDGQGGRRPIGPIWGARRPSPTTAKYSALIDAVGTLPDGLDITVLSNLSDLEHGSGRSHPYRVPGLLVPHAGLMGVAESRSGRTTFWRIRRSGGLVSEVVNRWADARLVPEVDRIVQDLEDVGADSGRRVALLLQDQ